MKRIEEMQRRTIERLKEVREEHGLTIAQIMDMLDRANYPVSESTVKRVFAEGSEEQGFRYQDSIAPLADVLLDMYSDESEIEEITALKSLIREKNKMVSYLMSRLDEQEDHFSTRLKFYEERKMIYDHQIEVLEQQIRHKDKVIEKLLNTYILEKE